jgi:hypothetical protein
VKIEFPEDVAKIKAALPNPPADVFVAAAWAMFSEEQYCAGWISPRQSTLEEFVRWAAT